MHGDAQEVAIARLQVGDQRDEWELFVGVMPDVPVPLLVAKDQGCQWSCLLLAERTDVPVGSEDCDSATQQQGPSSSLRTVLIPQLVASPPLPLTLFLSCFSRSREMGTLARSRSRTTG